MAARHREQAVPPYVSYRSWEALLKLLGGMSRLPSSLDSSVWDRFRFSGSTRSALKSALLFLGLRTPDNRPTEALDRLVAAKGDQKRDLLSALVDQHYRPLLGAMSLQRATRRELREAFQRSGLRGETAEKAILFLVALAKDAEVPLHEHLASRKISRRRPEFAAAKSIRNGEENRAVLAQRAEESRDDALPQDLHPAVGGLLHLLPPRGQSWATPDQHDLFLQAFAAAVSLAHGPAARPPEAGTSAGPPEPLP